MLRAENLNYKMGHRWLLKDLNFSFSCGQILAIAGKNGAGKSTLLKLLGGAFPLTSGAILWKGRLIDNYRRKKWATHRAFLSQHQHLSFDFSVYETVMMGRYPHFCNRPSAKDHQAVSWAMEQTSVSALKHKSYVKLSGGERQRTHFARILAQLGPGISHEGKLLLLDEPISNLDVYHQYKCMQTIKEFAKKGGTAVVVLHDMNMVAEFADKILLLHQGSLIGFGAPAEILDERLLGHCFSCSVKIGRHPFRNHPLICFDPLLEIQ